jgi:hypothetical protein
MVLRGLGLKLMVGLINLMSLALAIILGLEVMQMVGLLLLTNLILTFITE